MDNQEKWGPWITHDGKGCPCLGEWVDLIYDNLKTSNDIFGGPVIAEGSPSWFGNVNWVQIIRYRIRKPRGLTMLKAIARDTTTPIVKVDA